MLHRSVCLVIHTDITEREGFDRRFSVVAEQLRQHGVTNAELVFFGERAQEGANLFRLHTGQQPLDLPNLGYGDNLLAGLALSRTIGAKPSLVIVFHHFVFHPRDYAALGQFFEKADGARHLLIICPQESGANGAGFAGVIVEQLGRKRMGMCSHTRQPSFGEQLDTQLPSMLSIG